MFSRIFVIILATVVLFESLVFASNPHSSFYVEATSLFQKMSVKEKEAHFDDFLSSRKSEERRYYKKIKQDFLDVVPAATGATVVFLFKNKKQVLSEIDPSAGTFKLNGIKLSIKMTLDEIAEEVTKQKKTTSLMSYLFPEAHAAFLPMFFGFFAVYMLGMVLAGAYMKYRNNPKAEDKCESMTKDVVSKKNETGERGDFFTNTLLEAKKERESQQDSEVKECYSKLIDMLEKEVAKLEPAINASGERRPKEVTPRLEENKDRESASGQ